jgi:signal peptidase II
MSILQLLTVLMPLSIIIVDRITKAYAVAAYVIPRDVWSWLTFELVYNRGISWGLLHDYNAHANSIVMLLVIMVMCVFIQYTWRRYKADELIVAELCVLAGACSNFWDRLWYPGVIDFIHVRVCTWHWAIFNVAVCAIACGVLAMFIYQYKEISSHDIL